MTDDLSVCVFKNTSKKKIYDSTPLSKGNLQHVHKSIVSSPTLSIVKPRKKIKLSKKIELNPLINKHNTNDISNKLFKNVVKRSKNNELSLNSGNKKANKDSFSSSYDKLLNQKLTEDCINNTTKSGKENIFCGSKIVSRKGTVEDKMDTVNEKCYRLSARRCLFIDSIKSIQASDKASEKSMYRTNFKPEVMNSTYENEDLTLIEAQSSPYLPVLSEKELKNVKSVNNSMLKERKINVGNLLEKNNSRAFNNTTEFPIQLVEEKFSEKTKWYDSKQNKISCQGKHKHCTSNEIKTDESNYNEIFPCVMNVQDELDFHTDLKKSFISITKNINDSNSKRICHLDTNKNVETDNFQHTEKNKLLNCIAENNQMSKSNICCDRNKKSKKKCSKLVERNIRIKMTERYFEPISDDEQDKYVIEQFLSQSEITDKGSSLSKTSTNKSGVIHSENVAFNYSKSVQPSSLVLQTEIQNLEKNKTCTTFSNYNIEANYVNNTNSLGNKENSFKGERNTAFTEKQIQVLRSKTKTKLNLQRSLNFNSLDEFHFEKEKINHIEKSLDLYSDDMSQSTSPIFSGKRSRNQSCKEILDLFSNDDMPQPVSPILSKKISQKQSHKVSIDLFSNNNISRPTSPILSGGISQNQNHKEILDLLSSYDELQPKLSKLPGKHCQKQSHKEMLDQFDNDDNTEPSSPILLGKQSLIQNHKGMLDLFSNDDKIQLTSPILSGIKSKKQSYKELLDFSRIDGKTQSKTQIMSSEKKPQNESNRYISKGLNKDENNKISISLLPSNSSISDLIILGSTNESNNICSKEKVFNYSPKKVKQYRLNESFEYVSKKRHHASENFIVENTRELKSVKSDENDKLLIDEFPTQSAFFQPPMNVSKKFKLDNSTYNSDIIFTKSNKNNGTFSEKNNQFETEERLLNQSPVNNEFKNGIDLSNFSSQNDISLKRDLNLESFYSSKFINRSVNETQEIIEDFISQEKSDCLLSELVIETQSSPRGDSLSSQVSESHPPAPVNKSCSSNKFSQQINPPLDSPEIKRKLKPKCGSLTQRLKRLLHFQRSMFCMWKHNGELNVTNNLATLQVTQIWNKFGRIILDCCQNVSTLGSKRNTTEKIKVRGNILTIVEPSAANNVSKNCIISIHPPWQSMIFEEINLVVILNVTRLQVVSRILHVIQPQKCKIGNKKFSCSCTENPETGRMSNCNFHLPLKGAELMSPLYQVNRLHNPKFFQAQERSIAAAITNSFLTGDLSLELSILHQFRSIDKTGLELLNAMAVDKNGDCCQITLKTPMDENKWQNIARDENKIYLITGLVLNNRLNIESCNGLSSILNLICPEISTQRFLYIFSPLSDWWTIKPILDENLALYTFSHLPTNSLQTWMNSDQKTEFRIRLFVKTITFKGNKLYVCDCSSTEYFIILISDYAATYSFMKNGTWLNLYCVKSEGGKLYVDKYSNIEIASAMFSTSLFPSVEFPPLNMHSKLGEIVTLTGTIIGINKEKGYMSWHCECGNEMACVVNTHKIYYCDECNHCTSNCIIKLQLDVYVHITEIPATIRMELHEDTVKEFLQKCDYNEVLSTDVKYNFSAVFGTSIKALCLITHVAKNIEKGTTFSTIIKNSEEDVASYIVEEIKL